jgi:hypothetical protein
MVGVRTEAVEFIAGRVRGKVLNGEDTTAWLLNVTDEAEKTVLIMNFSAALHVTNDSIGG